jgi:hypothetical protein
MSSPAVTPERILQTGLGFFASKTWFCRGKGLAARKGTSLVTAQYARE